MTGGRRHPEVSRVNKRSMAKTVVSKPHFSLLLGLETPLLSTPCVRCGHVTESGHGTWVEVTQTLSVLPGKVPP